MTPERKVLRELRSDSRQKILNQSDQVKEGLLEQYLLKTLINMQYRVFPNYFSHSTKSSVSHIPLLSLQTKNLIQSSVRVILCVTLMQKTGINNHFKKYQVLSSKRALERQKYFFFPFIFKIYTSSSFYRPSVCELFPVNLSTAVMFLKWGDSLHETVK